MKMSILISTVALSMVFAATGKVKQERLNISVDGNNIINTLPDQFFGHNYWMWCKTWGNSIAGTESAVAALNLGMLRLGGISVDVDYPDRVSEEVLADFYTYCQKVGAEPLLQLQLASSDNTEDRVKKALDMISYFKTLGELTYVSIGNEPDLYPDNLATNPDYGVEYLSSYTLDNYCTDFNAVASRLKEKYPDLKIVGLELSHKYNTWIPTFISRCKEYVDIVSLHYYPNSAEECTYRNVRSDVSSMKNFYEDVRSYIDKNAGGKEIPLIIGETNISWDGDPEHSTYNASPGTFNAGLWIADFAGISSAQPKLFSIMPWSIREGWTLGFIDGSKKPRPVYYIYQLFSTYSKKHMIHSEIANSFVRIYGYKDDENNVSLFAINWDTLSSYTADFAFTNILSGSSFSYTIPPQSISCLIFSDGNAGNPRIIKYTNDMTGGPATPARDISPGTTVKSDKPLTVTFNSKRNLFTIQASRSYDNVKAEVVNIRGQLIHTIDIGTITEGKSSFTISRRNSAFGIHVIRLLSDQKVIFIGKVQ